MQLNFIQNKKQNFKIEILLSIHYAACDSDKGILALATNCGQLKEGAARVAKARVLRAVRAKVDIVVIVLAADHVRFADLQNTRRNTTVHHAPPENDELRVQGRIRVRLGVWQTGQLDCGVKFGRRGELQNGHVVGREERRVAHKVRMLSNSYLIIRQIDF